MPNFGELLADSEAMKRSAAEVARMCINDAASVEDMEDMNEGIRTEEEFSAIVNRIGRGDPREYEGYCALGREDF